MGCGGSTPAVSVETPVAEHRQAMQQQQQQPQQRQQQDTKNGRGGDIAGFKGGVETSFTRARRLSIVPAPGTSGAAAPDLNEVKEEGEEAHSVRNRRLSYVSAGGQKAGPSGPTIQNPELQPIMHMNPDKVPMDEEMSIDCEIVCISRAGQDPVAKKQNQDNAFVYDFYMQHDQRLFAALDGHGPNGHMVSGFVKQHLPEILSNQLKQEPDNIPAALTEGFLEMDDKLASSFVDCEFSGSTACVTLLKGKTLYTAWLGDSRGVLGRQTSAGLEGIDLTIDHKPDDPEEMRRIHEKNGRVERLVDEAGEPIGPPRVWLQYAWIPGLAMSRALGDKIAHTVGVISEPGISVLDLFPADKFIILASDGVWEFISSQEAVEMIGKFDDLQEGVEALINEAYARWLEEEEGVVDDITATVVRFHHKEQ